MGIYDDEARRSLEQQEAFRRWVQARIDTIHQRVSAEDVLRRNGIKLRYGGKRSEQIFCPFHGNTRTMAARFHPESNRKSDHVWCFVCNEQWDCISLFKKFEGYEGKFSGLLRLIERAYGIIPPEAPPEQEEEVDESERVEIEMMIETCENRLRGAKHVFEMNGYLILGSVLDRVSYAFEHDLITPDKTRDTLQKVLDKIGEKCRSCPAD